MRVRAQKYGSLNVLIAYDDDDEFVEWFEAVIVLWSYQLQSDQLAPLLEGRPSCPSICPSLASSPSFGGASGFIPLKLFKSAKSPKKIAGGTGIIFKFNVGTWPGVSQISSCVL